MQFSETASCISYFCHVCNLFSDCGSSTECCFVKCPFRDYDKADQGAVQVPIFYDDNLASIPVHAVNLKNASLETVLDKALEGKGVSYRIEDGVVYLSKKKRGRQLPR